MGVVVCSYDGRRYGWDNEIEFGVGFKTDDDIRYTILMGESISIPKDRSSTEVLESILPKIRKKYKVGKMWSAGLGECIYLPFAKDVDKVKDFIQSLLEEEL